MHNPFLVSATCPECGAPVRYPEGAYSFRCEFCASVLRTSSDGRDLEYIIPSRLEQREILTGVKRLTLSNKKQFGSLKKVHRIKTVYKSFWYFKGMVYVARTDRRKNNLYCRTWYHTFQANGGFLPRFHSLGTRVEVLTIHPYESGKYADSGDILPLEVDREEAERQAVSNAALTADPTDEIPLFKRASIIGERFFIIYYPFIQVECSGEKERSLVFDGIHGGFVSEEKAGAYMKDDRPHTTVTLLTHRCGNCGHDLKPGDFDIFYHCGNCGKLWLLEQAGYKNFPIKVLEGEGDMYLPFWRLRVEAWSDKADIVLRNAGDLSRLMKAGELTLRGVDPEKPLDFFVPALVGRNAQAVLKLGARFSAFQREMPETPGSPFPEKLAFNASLELSEAEEMLDPLLFSVIDRTDPPAVEFFKQMTIRVKEHDLVWYPFRERRGGLYDARHNYQVPLKSLGANLY